MDTFIIVLGNHDKNTKNKRVTSAVNCYDSLMNVNSKYLIMSGGSKHKISEAEEMKDIALSLGVPKDKILVEGKSRTTIENLKFSLELIMSRNIISSNLHIIVCSSRYHMKRSFVLGNHLLKGLSTSYISTDENVDEIDDDREQKILNMYLESILRNYIKAYA